jgi:hypothetical protein
LVESASYHLNLTIPVGGAFRVTCCFDIASGVSQSRDEMFAEIAAELVPIEQFDEHHAAGVIEGVKWGFGVGERASHVALRRHPWIEE